MKPLPEYGPLEIENLHTFLLNSKSYFLESFGTKSDTGISDIRFEDLVQIKVVGVGSFGTVLLMKHINSDYGYYAVKTINKKEVVKTRQIQHMLNEKKILCVMNFPFIIHLHKFYQDNSYLYFVMPFISGGDLFTRLRKSGKFDDGMARFYTAQIVLAIEYLHFLDIIYRDLKPENVLLDHTGYLKLIDFGFGKSLHSRTWTLCGTPEYLAPEMVLNKGYGKPVDWWALGVLIFEMLSGRSPFFANDTIRIYNKILANRYVFPPDISQDAKSIIKQFLEPDISKRIGELKGGVQDIKDQLWFRPLNWLTVLNRKMEPPYLPDNSHPGENFGNFKQMQLKRSTNNLYSKEFECF